MTKQHLQTSLAEQAAARIQREHITPRSRMSVLAEQAGYVLLFLVVFASLVFVVNLIWYWFRESGASVFFGLGWPGTRAALLVLPYSLLGLALLAFGLTILTLRHYDISYRQPATVVIGILVLALGLGGWMGVSALNARLAARVEQGGFRPLAPYMTRHAYPEITDYTLIGTLDAVAQDELSVRTRERTVVVEVGADTSYRPSRSLLIGERVHVVGERLAEDRFRADAVYQRPGRRMMHQ